MRKCFLCQKSSVMGGRRSFLRSHYNPTCKVRKYPNLQWAKLPSGKRAKICVRCLKSMTRLLKTRTKLKSTAV